MKRFLKRALAALLAFCTALLVFAGCTQDPEKERAKAYYDLAVEAYNNKDLLTAREYFIAADGYGNSKTFIEAIDEYERIYLEAVQQLEAKDYDAAKASFEAVRDYSNAEDYLVYINDLKAFYEDGLRLYSEEDFELSRERFVQSCDYGRAAEYIASIDAMESRYQDAMRLYREQHYNAAIAAFEAIGANYKDTYDMISVCYGELEHAGVSITDYLTAYLKSNGDENEQVSFVMTDVNETGFMVSDTKGMLFTGSTDVYGIVQSIAFWVDDNIVVEKGRAYVDRLLAHCIRALDIEMMSYSDVLANIAEYTDGKATYGNFSFELSYEDSGHAVLNARYIYGSAEE